MQKKTSFSYPTLQRIKSEEYERFFEGSQYYPYLNHLGELKWMTEEQADQQHEFFLYEESFVLRIKRKFGARRYPSWEKLPDKEKEIRLQIRKYLEETYRGELSPQTTRMLPNQWEAELTREEIESIPISLEIYESIGPNKSLVTAIFVLIICAGALLYFGPFNNSARSGALLVKTNVESARVYLNDKLFGYSGDEIANVPLGTHRVSLAKSGFVPIPKEKEIQIKNDTLIILNFRMDPVRSSDHGYLTVSADYSDSKIFIDNEYYGVIEDEPYLPLREGQHTVVIEKPGYVSVPERQGVTIAAGDTTFLQFEQRRAYSAPTSNQNNRGSNLRGTLEVN
ncbi:PEGA domain-containing protein, partial [Candidatus Saccharibacteria bacterium]|nr:PEGA domain-containing protein [Candidatus Saccharibacteria bacterium]NIW79230.1 PEGA domain-containing protein [Calditrichia bacterium]